MQKNNTPITPATHITNLPEGLQEAINGYYAIAATDEALIKEAIPVVSKKGAEGKNIDLASYKSKLMHDGWELEFIHPELVDEFVAKKLEDGDIVRKVKF